MRTFALNPLWRERWTTASTALEAALAEEPIDEERVLALFHQRQKLINGGPGDLSTPTDADRAAAKAWLQESRVAEERIAALVRGAQEALRAALVAAERNAALAPRFEAPRPDRPSPIFSGSL
jgi:hypothetical protein